MNNKAFYLTIMCILLCTAMTAQNIILPAPQKEGGKPLMQALNERQTNRDFSNKMLEPQILSNLLWAANGINREESGKRTAPTARNCQQIDIYAYTADGVYLYLPKTHELQLIVKGDYRGEAGMQPFVKEAPVLLIMVANYDKMKDMDDAAQQFYGATDCGNVCQNICLFCASEGLHTVTLGSIQRDKIKDLLKFNGKAILGQPVGYPRNKYIETF